MSCNTKKEIKSFDIEMNEYQELANASCFKGITLNSLEDVISNKKTCYIFLCYPQSDKCQLDIDYISKIALEKEKVIYYMDIKEILKIQEAYSVLLKLLDPVLKEKQGSKLLDTPELIFIEKGEFKSYIIQPDDLKLYESIFKED